VSERGGLDRVWKKRGIEGSMSFKKSIISAYNLRETLKIGKKGNQDREKTEISNQAVIIS